MNKKNLGGRPRKVKRAGQKYHNQKIKVDGMTFDSLREFRRWNYLLLRQEKGQITELRRQVPFPLIPAQYAPGNEVYKRGPRKGEVKQGPCIEKSLSYIADFVYRENGTVVVEDAKGVRTEAYGIKRKLMLYIHGIKISEV